MGFGDNVTTNLSEWLYVSNVKQAYWFTNNIDFIGHTLKYSHQSLGLDYMEETQSYLALQGW
jgi:phage anti-repressor protein